MRWISVLVLGVFVVSSPMLAGPPTVSPETTYYQEPLDDEGYVDYVAALNAAFGDADALPHDNAFLGILEQVDTSNWPKGHVPALYAALEVRPVQDERPKFITFYDYAETHGMPRAAKFDLENATPGDEPPPPPLGTAQGMQEYASTHPWTDVELPEVARWLDEIRIPLNAIVESINRPSYYAPSTRPDTHLAIIEIMLPHVGVQRGTALALGMRLRRHLANNNIDAAISDWKAIKRLARLQKREPFLISNLVGISIQSLSNDAFTLIMSHPELDIVHTEEMGRIFNDLPAGVSMQEVIECGERVFVLDNLIQASRGRVEMMQLVQMNSPSASYGEPTTFFVNGRSPDPLTALISDPSFHLERALRRINTAWDQWFGEVPVEYADFVDRKYVVEAEIEHLVDQARTDVVNLISMGQTGIPEETDIDLIADQTANLLLGSFTSSMFSAIDYDRKFQAQAALEPVALALAAYRIDQGGYPPLLQSLIPDYLDVVPADPLGDQSLRYRREADGYLLYSVGTNLTDDGGVHDFREGDIVLAVPWSVDEE